MSEQAITNSQEPMAESRSPNAPAEQVPGALPNAATEVLLAPSECPMVPWPFAEAQVRAAVARAAAGDAKATAWLDEVAKLFNEREELIRLASEDGDPYVYGWEFPHWLDADRELKECGKGQYVAGGKRATKSERAARRIVQAAMHLPRGKIWCFQGAERTSISEQQALIWKYLPRYLKEMNGRTRHGFSKINWSQDGGFAQRLLVLPNRTEIHFLTYGQDPKDFQGWSIGAVIGKREAELLARTPWLFNLGAWMDEDAPLNWLETVQTRCASRGACWMWTFSTLAGITATIKQLLVGARTVRSRPAAALAANRKYVPDCPVGAVPYTQRVQAPGVSVIYFHTDLNPLPPHYDNMLALVKEKPPAVILRDLYGYTEDTRQRAFPLFGGWNLVDPEQLPATGTNYMLTDPAGNRNWATIWVRVAPGNPPRLYVYRDWPDARRFGPWTVPSQKVGGGSNPDGDAGPAQRSMGFGWVKYKQTWLAEERVIGGKDFNERERDPYRRGLVAGALPSAATGAATAGIDDSREPRAEAAEVIYIRWIDPRAGRDEKVVAEGGSCAIDELARTHTNAKSGEVDSPPMYFQPAPGLRIDTGIQAVNDLLDWNKDEPLVPLVNEPHLYVARGCEQVIWTLENYTALGGEDGGCKDFADLLRYAATAELRHVEPGMLKTTGGGGY